MSLRAQGLKGGAYLGTREAFGILVRLVGVLLLTRLIGPDNFGVYAGSLAVVTVLATFAQLGTEAYLMRLPADEAHPDRFHEAFTLVALSSVGITALCWVAGLILLSQLDGVSYLWPFLVLTLSIPINTMWAPSQALIERDLRYRQMAILEVGSDVVLYGVALPIAFADGGVWAPVAGWLAAQTWLLFGSAFLARYRPRWRWSGSEVRSMVRWGFPFAAGTWVLTYPTEIVNPIIVGPLLGTSGVGYVALLLRLVDTLGFVQRATRRMALVIFGRVQSDLERLKRAVEDAMALQLLALGVPLAGFGLVVEEALPRLFGQEWAPAVDAYPTFALAFFLTAAFQVQASALAVTKRNAPIVLASIAQLALIVVAALAFIPSWELEGVGAARLVSVVGLIGLHLALHPTLGFSYRKGLVWVLTLGPAIALSAAPWPWRGLAIVCGASGLLVPVGRHQIIELLQLVLGRARAAAPDTPPAVATIAPAGSSTREATP
ncbi:MAG: oligosaccharide flippase family protein [Acidimicrobiales bacterium]|nr:oligosaccharide flippase family protein [Acidimicrobiales bacterium]